MGIKPFRLERHFAKHEYTAGSALTSSDCEPLAQAELLSMADDETREMWDRLTLAYTEYRGLTALREEISTLYERITPEEVLVAAPEECIFLAMNCLLQRGDHVICAWPGYQSLYELAAWLGCEVERWEPDEAEGWKFDPGFLRAAVRPNTRLIVFNFPHNPTGHVPARRDFEEMIEIASERGIHVFSDEMYRMLELEAGERLPAACDLYERGISLFGMSKSFGMAGARIGWLATRDAAHYAEMVALKDYTTICSSAPSEVLSLIGLRAREAIVERHLERIRRNLGLLSGFFERRAGMFAWSRPVAGTLAFPRLLTGESSEDFCDGVLAETGELLMASTMFEYGTEHFRVGFGRQEMPEALERLEQYLLHSA